MEAEELPTEPDVERASKKREGKKNTINNPDRAGASPLSEGHGALLRWPRTTTVLLLSITGVVC
jgi:hypothetical protein